MVEYNVPDDSSEEEQRAKTPGTFQVPSTESSPSSGKSSPRKDTSAPTTSPPRDHHNASHSQRSSSSSPPRSPPLFSPQFNNGIRKLTKPDPFALRGKQVTRTKRRVWRGERGRHVLVRSVPKENRSSERGIRATKRLLSYPGLIRLLDHRGFGAGDSDKRRVLDSARETEWDFADLGTLQRLLDRPKYAEGLPENFIWHVLLSLLKTALYLHTGADFDADVQYPSTLLSPSYNSESPIGSPKSATAEEIDDAADSWGPIIHNQIDPWNISFYSHDEEDPLGTQRYPHVKLGNLTRVTLLPSIHYQPIHEDFPPLPKYLQTNFEAPEVAWNYTFGPDGTKSDLWSIGAVAVVMMGGPGGIAAARKVKVWDDVAGKRTLVKPCSDEAFYNESSKMIKAGKWRWTAADLNQKYPGKYSMELRCFLERLLTVVPKQRPDTLEAVVWASNYYVHWLRSGQASKDAATETGVDLDGMDQLEEDSDTQQRIDANRRVGGTTPFPTPSPERTTLTGKAPLDPNIEQVELPNIDAEVASETSSEDFSPGPPAHLLRELELLQNKANS